MIVTSYIQENPNTWSL